MMKCLETNKVCTNLEKKCKVCKLDDCKMTLKIIEEQEKNKNQEKLKRIKEELPQECKECGMYKIIDMDKAKIYCAYRLNNSCMLKKDDTR